MEDGLPVDTHDADLLSTVLDALQRMVDAKHDQPVVSSLADLVEAVLRPELGAMVAVFTEEGSVASLAPGSFLRSDVPRLTREIAMQGFERGRPCVVEDALDGRGATRDAVAPDDAGGFRSMLVVPLLSDLMLTASARVPAAFTDDDLRTVSRLCEIAESVAGRSRNPPDVPEAVYGLVSHDIRSPLQAAQAWVEVARTEEDPAYLDRVTMALDRIEDYLASAESILEMGLLVHSTRAVDLAATVDGVAETLDDEVAVEFVDTATVEADPVSLARIVDNLLRNVVDHAGAGATVTIGTTDDGFYVEDDGLGIVGDRRDAVTERGTSSAIDHAGLGLSIVTRLAEGHGWHLDVEESGSGGARFVFSDVQVLAR